MKKTNNPTTQATVNTRLLGDTPIRHIPELGVRIQVVERERAAEFDEAGWDMPKSVYPTYVNFYGQVVGLDYEPVALHNMACLVEMTGEPTEIGLVQPERMCLMENAALAELKDALELEAFKCLERMGTHRLPLPRATTATAGPTCPASSELK